MAQVNADGSRLVVKKLFVKISLAIGTIAFTLLILLGLRLVDGDGTVPSYRFLAGRSPAVCVDAKTGGMDKCYVYSFEGDFNDFNDVCLNADAELISAGFVDRTQPRYRSRERDYWLKGSFPRGPVWIVIRNDHAYIEYPDSKKGGLCIRKGCFVVMITYWRSWRWPF